MCSERVDEQSIRLFRKDREIATLTHENLELKLVIYNLRVQLAKLKEKGRGATESHGFYVFDDECASQCISESRKELTTPETCSTDDNVSNLATEVERERRARHDASTDADVQRKKCAQLLHRIRQLEEELCERMMYIADRSALEAQLNQETARLNGALACIRDAEMRASRESVANNMIRRQLDDCRENLARREAQLRHIYGNLLTLESSLRDADNQADAIINKLNKHKA